MTFSLPHHLRLEFIIVYELFIIRLPEYIGKYYLLGHKRAFSLTPNTPQAYRDPAATVWLAAFEFNGRYS